MKIDRVGITFKYRGVNIIYHWPLLQVYFCQARFEIPSLNFESSSLFKCISRVKELPEDNLNLVKGKVQGCYFEDAAKELARGHFSKSYGILLLDMDVSSKPSEFWNNVPKSYIKEFCKDMVFINCSSVDEVYKLMFSLPRSFCLAIGYSHGRIIHDNN